MRRHVFIAALLLLSTFSGAALAGPYTAFYVLGDSQSDSGNVAALTTEPALPPYTPIPAAPYPSGRLTNGPVWAEYLAGLIGKNAAPSERGGTNYAYATARIDDRPVTAAPVPTLAEQEVMLRTALGGALPSDALFAVWGGANDVGDALLSADPLARIDTAITTLDGILRDMAGVGARNFLVPNLGDLGLAPIFSDPTVSPQATALTVAFNTRLSLTLDQLVFDEPDLNLITLDVFALSQDVHFNPGDYGLSNSTDPCLRFGVSDPVNAVCPNPDEYLFWDALHFTTAVHGLLADAAYDAVPLPAPLALIVIGLWTLAGLHRRHLDGGHEPQIGDRAMVRGQKPR